MLEYDNLSKDIFLNPRYANQKLAWASTDSLDNFTANRKQKDFAPVEAYFKENPISYEFNSYGYRSPEFTEYDDGEFILVCGCSHTMGIGNRLEDLWWYKLGKELELPVINLAMESFGTDLMMYNTNFWINKKYPVPKMVIYQHPFTNREAKIYIEDGRITVYSDTVDVNHDQVMYNQSFKYGMITDILTATWNAQDIPVLHWGFQPDSAPCNSFSCTNILQIAGADIGRDNTHDGPESHAKVVEQLLPLAKKALTGKLLNIPNKPNLDLYSGNSDTTIEQELGDAILKQRDQDEIIYE